MKHELRPTIHMEEPVLTAVGWVGCSLRGSPEHPNSVSQVVGVSDMVPAFRICVSVGGGFRRGTMASGRLSVWEKTVPHLSF